MPAPVDTLLYRSGDAFLPERIRRFLGTFVYGSYQTPVYINYWSFMHAFSGILLALLLLRAPQWIPFSQLLNPYLYGFLVHTVWELWQVAIGMSRPFTAQGHNGLTDIVLDTAFFMVGMAIVLEGREWLKPRPTTAERTR
jgi:hypothetical protein